MLWKEVTASKLRYSSDSVASNVSVFVSQGLTFPFTTMKLRGEKQEGPYSKERK